MLVNKFLDDLAVEQVAGLREGQVVECVVVEDIFPVGRQDDLVEISVRRAVQDLCHVVNDLLVKCRDTLL